MNRDAVLASLGVRKEVMASSVHIPCTTPNHEDSPRRQVRLSSLWLTSSISGSSFVRTIDLFQVKKKTKRAKKVKKTLGLL